MLTDTGILVMDQFVQRYGTYDAQKGQMIISSSRQSLVTSIINAGEFVGALTAFLVCQRIGLRGGLLLACLIVVVGTTLQVAGTHIGLLIAGRLVLGMGYVFEYEISPLTSKSGYAVGLISCFVPLYIADCAPAKIRGALVTMYQFDIGIGLILGVCIDYATAKRTDTGSFRIPIAAQYIFPIILAPGLLLFCPESPRWLASKNRIDECKASLRRLKGPKGNIVEELEHINSILHEESIAGEGSTWREVMTKSPERRKAYLGWALQGKAATLYPIHTLPGTWATLSLTWFV